MATPAVVTVAVEPPSVEPPGLAPRARLTLTTGLAVAFVLAALAQRGLENVWVLYTGYRYGWDERTNGLALALVGLMAVLVQGLLVRPAVSNFGERSCIRFGLAVSTVFTLFVVPVTYDLVYRNRPGHGLAGHDAEEVPTETALEDAR